MLPNVFIDLSKELEHIVDPLRDIRWSLKLPNEIDKAYKIFKEDLDLFRDVGFRFKETEPDSLAHLSFNNGYIYLGKEMIDMDLFSWVNVLAHEMTHAKQVEDGRLIYSHNHAKLYWEGEDCTFLYKNNCIDEMPWEVEAYTQQVLLVTKYYRYLLETIPDDHIFYYLYLPKIPIDVSFLFK